MGIAQKIAKNSFFGLVASVSEMGISFIVGILLARNLGADQYGLYSYMIWFLGIGALISNLGLGEMGRRFIPESLGTQNLEEACGFVRITLLYRTLVSLIIAIVIGFTAQIWANLAGAPDQKLLFVVIAISVLPQGLQLALGNLFKGFQKYDYSFYLVLATGPLRLLIVIIVSIFDMDVMDVLFINLGTFILAILFGFILLRKLIPLKGIISSKVDSERKNPAMKYALTVAGILTIGYIANNQAEIFIIGLYCSIEDVGFYRLAFLIGQIIGLAPIAINFALIPSIAEQMGKRDSKRITDIYHTSMRYLMLIAVPSAAGAMILAESIIGTLYGTDFLPAARLFQIMSFPLVINFISAGIGDIIRGINHAGYILKITILAAITKIAISMWLIPAYGINGAAIAASITFVIVFLFSLVFITKKLSQPWPVKDTILILLSSLIMGLVVYAVQSQMGNILSLIICIPLGAAIYVLTIIFFKVIRENDLSMLSNIGDSLPNSIKSAYFFFFNPLKKLALKRIHGSTTDLTS